VKLTFTVSLLVLTWTDSRSMPGTGNKREKCVS